jgi:hypothetical protein
VRLIASGRVAADGVAEADARSIAVLWDELDSGHLQCAAKSGKCRAMSIAAAEHRDRLPFGRLKDSRTIAGEG